MYEFVGPGMPRQFYLDQLATTGYTGWYDENGVPAPWPEDFCDLAAPSGWQPTAQTTAILPNPSDDQIVAHVEVR